MTSKRQIVPRRRFLKKSLQAGATLSLLPASALAQPQPPVITLAGYASPLSVRPGDELSLHLSSNAPRVSIEIVRMGLRRDVVWSTDNVNPGVHAVPANASERGCGWPVSQRVRIGADWRSGYYSVFLRAHTSSGVTPPQEAFFIVRPRTRDANTKILFQCATNTYQAYNQWGGSCLYSGPNHPRVSFERPFTILPQRRRPSFYNPNVYCHHYWDEPFILWAEQAGYAIDYCANLDLELHPEMLRGYRLVLSVGHDEYWSAGMRDHLERYIGAGGNVAFFSGNTCCWQVRTEEGGKALTCHKRAHERDPVFQTPNRASLSTLWSDPLVGRPENRLTGVGFPYGGYNRFFGEFMTGRGSGEYQVHQPDHWVFAGTGLRGGEWFGGESGIAGYECDGCEMIVDNGRPIPTGRDGTPRNFQILATAPARWSRADGSIDWVRQVRAGLRGDPAPADVDAGNGNAVLGLYTRGGTVLTVGSTDWPLGLAARDHVVQRIVRNVLDRLSV